MGDLTFRVLGPDELRTAQLVADRASGVRVSERVLALELARSEDDRWYGAFDGDRLVGSTRNLSCRLTLPGPPDLGPLADVPVANAAWTGVLPTHRRRGILRQMQRWHMEDARRHGEMAIMGTPSQSTIYGRFGHGPISALQSVRIETHSAHFRRPFDASGTVRFVDAEHDFTAIRSVYELYRRRQPGEVTRTDAVWELVRAETEPGAPLFWVVYRAAGGIDEGYAGYQVVEHDAAGRSEKVLRLRELVSATPAAHAALWRFCLDLDLVTAVEGWVPGHDAVRWLLADQRRLEVRGHLDRVWMRPVDPAAFLEARGYGTDDTITVHVVDDFLPENSGVYTVTGVATGGKVVRGARRVSDLSLSVGDLATVLFGAASFATLAAAGLVEAQTTGALRRADAMFGTQPPPACISPI
jgi:predicted acetyltransferase